MHALVCVHAFVCMHLRKTLSCQVHVEGTDAFQLPRAARLGSQVIFSRLLDGISIHIRLYNFHSEGVLSLHDFPTLLLTPLNTQIQSYFPTSAHLAKGHHFVCLFVLFSK